MSPKRLLEQRRWISGAQVVGELGRDRARLDERDAHVAARDLLAQRLAERADAVLGEVVDARAGARDPPGDRADVHEVGDVARAVARRPRAGAAAPRGRRTAGPGR